MANILVEEQSTLSPQGRIEAFGSCNVLDHMVFILFRQINATINKSY